MKRIFTKGFAIALLAMMANIAMAQTYTFPVKEQQGFSLSDKTRDGMRISYELGSFTLDQLNYRGEEMSEISINAICIPNDEGLPNLPVESRMIAIPQGATATLNVVRAETQTFQNVNIAPALRIQAENEEPEANYEKDMKVYGKNALYPENPFVMGTSSIRGVDVVNVAITPFQYNPVTKELVVYTDVELSLSYEGGNGHIGDDRLRSPYWDPILASELANYDQLPVIDYEARMQDWIRNNRDGAEYIIVIPNNEGFMEPAQRLKDFRMKQGIITEIVRLDEMPATTTALMKTWFHNAYNNWEIAPVAVLLFGDHNTNMAQGIPAITVSHPYSSTCITDIQYADVTGGDNLPEMVFSRLVAADATEAAMMADKQIEYEYTNPNTDPNFYASPITALGWQTERWFQLCSEVFGGYMRNHGYTPQRINCIYQGTPGSSWSSAQNTAQVTNYFGPNGTNYIPASPAEMGGWTGGSPEQVVQAVNNGSFWVQHRDHGLDEGWGEPAVRNPHIDQMNNVGKMPFVMSINCQTGMFNYTGSNGNCFTEKWMRRTSNGQNAGAVGVLSPTEVSYSFVNDAFVWGVYDQFDPNFMPSLPANTAVIPAPTYENRGNWRPAFGNVAGKYFLAETSWPYNTDSKDITYIMFTAHCDAFLRIYTQVPETMAVNHQSVQLAGLNTFQITAPEGTTIALTKGEGETLEVVAVATATGSVQNIEIAPQVPPTVLHLTVTGQNYLRYEADIDVIPADGPYIIINEYALSNQATQLNFGEESGFDLVLKNVGNSQAPAGSATLSTESEYITITNGTVDFSSIASNLTTSLTNAFSFTVSDEVPNNTPIEFTVTITSGDDTYDNHINMKAYAPSFEIGNVGIREINGNGNGRLDPGETVRLSFVVYNRGNADSYEVNGNLTINNVFMQNLGEPGQTISSIPANEGLSFEYQIYVGAAPSGFAAEYTFDVASGVYTDSRDFMTKIGLNVEDFESGVLDPSLWTNGSTTPWTFCTDEPYEGNTCLKSGAIGSNGETLLSLTYEVAAVDSIAFYLKVSSESGYDKIYFYIDNHEQGNWSGSVGWTRQQFAINPGQHIFSWKYKKDGSVNTGSDCAWIDFVILPRDMSLTASAGLDIDACQGEPAHILGYASNYETLAWTTAGDGTFDDATLADPMYTPGAQDLANGSVTLTMTATKGSQTITDDMTVSFNEPVEIGIALNDVTYCGTSEPQPVAVEVLSGNYTSFYWSTNGDGVFEDPYDLSTNYIPGEQDIANGTVMLTANAESAGCGTMALEYPFVMNPTPSFTMGLIPPCAYDYCQGQDIEMPVEVEFSGFIDGQLTIVINGESYTVREGEPFLLPTANLEPGSYSFDFEHLSNGICEIDLNNSFSFGIIEAPNLTVDETYYEICQGESIDIALHTSGGNPNNPEAYHFTVNGENIDPIEITGDSYTLTLTPTENTSIHLTSIDMENECGGDCTTGLDITLTVMVISSNTAPVISGDTELDARITPTSTYTIDNGLKASFSLSPAEAGTIEIDDNNLTANIVWSQSFRGQATLTATPLSECSDAEGTLAITVKNSTGVDELSANTKLFPNPTTGMVNIECEGMTRISIFSAVGQMVYDKEVDADQISVDLSQHPAGSYLVRIITNQGTVVKKLYVK